MTEEIKIAGCIGCVWCEPQYPGYQCTCPELSKRAIDVINGGWQDVQPTCEEARASRCGIQYPRYRDPEEES